MEILPRLEFSYKHTSYTHHVSFYFYYKPITTSVAVYFYYIKLLMDKM